ncbi:MAG: PorT family protein [Muribaculaceae bacterium]|nr:PorT family protein [Muribaculaceae bacterium]
MKKIVITLLCVIIASGAAMAQKKFTFGPKVGVDLTHFWGKDLPHGMQFNYQVGAFMEYRFNDKISIAPEFVFAAQGGKMDARDYVEGFHGSADFYFNFNYINVPIMLKFYAIPKLSIDFGPQVGINVYSKGTAKAKADGASASYTKEFDGVKSIDFGVGLGATYNITNDVFVQGRYTMGLTKVFEDGDVYNGNIQLAIGYRF